MENNQRIEYLDGWRGLAILFVFIGHFFPNDTIDVARFGVNMFFVLSGLLMADILFIKRIELPKFFLRRFSRVYPGLLAFVGLSALLFLKTKIHVGSMAILSALTFTTNYAILYFHETGLFDHLWSLCVEEHSYIALGGLAYLERRGWPHARRLILWIGTLAMINGIIQSGVMGHQRIYWRTDVQCASIFMAAYIYLSQKIKVYSYAVPLLIIAAFCSSFYVFPIYAGYTVGIIFLAAGICSLDAMPEALKNTLSLPALRQFGLWSYSLYLWQQPFYKLAEEGYGPKYPLLLGAFIMGIVSFYSIERPLRKLINRKYVDFIGQKATLVTARYS